MFLRVIEFSMINVFHCIKDSFHFLVFIRFLVLNLFDLKGTASVKPKIMSQQLNIPWPVASALVNLSKLLLIQLLVFNRSSRVCRLSFISYLIKKHKPEQLLCIIVKYILQKACLNYLTAVDI